jgi:hypothetical protein
MDMLFLKDAFTAHKLHTHGEACAQILEGRLLSVDLASSDEGIIHESR